MLISELLLEAGINTANVHLAALKAMRNSYPRGLKAIIDKYGKEPDFESENSRVSYVDNIMEWIDKNPETFVLYSFLRVYNNELSHIARENTKKEFPEDFPDVRIETVEQSSDPKAKTTGGYYRYSDHSIVIFISENLMKPAIRSMMYEYVYGESDDYESIDRFTALIGRTFAHEYAHYEQFLRDKRKHNSADLSYVTLGKNNRGRDYSILGKKGGKRGGYARTPQASDVDNLRYYSARHEIDSFASGAAAELVGYIKKHEENDWNWTIRILMGSLKNTDTYSDRTSIDVTRYRNMLDNVFAGKYDSIGLNRNQFVQARNRFLKRVYEKLAAYLKPTAGKADEHDTKFLNKEWIQKAKTLSRAEMFQLLAKNVVDVLQKEYPDIERKEIIDGRNYYQSEAEEFIRKYYFNWETEEKHKDEALSIFRNYVAKLLNS